MGLKKGTILTVEGVVVMDLFIDENRRYLYFLIKSVRLIFLDDQFLVKETNF
jgi:hypothetical protein